MKTYGLIGASLAHSFSKKYFTHKFLQEGIDAEYRNFELSSIKQFPEFLSTLPNLAGLNVTIPYKEQIIPFLDELDEHATSIGAVNTIRIIEGKLKGYNTDWLGFERSLSEEVWQDIKHVLVLGSGGASKAIIYALRKRGLDAHVASSTGKGTISYENLYGLKYAFDMIVNCTPVGTVPDIHTMPPVPPTLFHSKQVVFDLIYNPEKTLLLAQAEKSGATILNGRKMLETQALEAWKIWIANIF